MGEDSAQLREDAQVWNPIKSRSMLLAVLGYGPDVVKLATEPPAVIDAIPPLVPAVIATAVLTAHVIFTMQSGGGPYRPIGRWARDLWRGGVGVPVQYTVRADKEVRSGTIRLRTGSPQVIDLSWLGLTEDEVVAEFTTPGGFGLTFVDADPDEPGGPQRDAPRMLRKWRIGPRGSRYKLSLNDRAVAFITVSLMRVHSEAETEWEEQVDRPQNLIREGESEPSGIRLLSEQKITRRP